MRLGLLFRIMKERSKDSWKNIKIIPQETLYKIISSGAPNI